MTSDLPVGLQIGTNGFNSRLKFFTKETPESFGNFSTVTVYSRAELGQNSTPLVIQTALNNYYSDFQPLTRARNPHEALQSRTNGLFFYPCRFLICEYEQGAIHL